MSKQNKNHFFEIHSSLFRSLFRKRSKETPARESPCAEQDEIERALQSDTQNDASIREQLEGIARNFTAHSSSGAVEHEDCLKRVYDLVSKGPIQFDVLCSRSGIESGDLSGILVLLEVNGLVERKSGDFYGALRKPVNNANLPLTSKSLEIVLSAIEFVEHRFQGISRKRLQNYIAAYWCHVDSNHWKVGSLWEACLKSGPIRKSELSQYVTSIFVKMPYN